MEIKITKIFSFNAAHHLTKYYGQCENIHGHTYKLKVTLCGEVQENGLVIDFVIFKRIVQKHILNYLDHKNLNDIIDNPTSENIAIWIYEKLKNFESLLKEEIKDPNLDEDIKKYLASTSNEIDKSQSDNKIKIVKIKLYESPTSYVTLIP
jgi:6-pyruvoyltetrahydropterin/6-carboxytetrahydropterin synthase